MTSGAATTWKKECGVILHREPLTCEIYGKEFFLAHGDGLGDDDRKFKFLRTVFHSHTLQCLFSALHPRWSVELGLEWAKHSRLKRENGREPDYMGEDNNRWCFLRKITLRRMRTSIISSLGIGISCST